MRSLILGATGQIGALLAEECERRDDAVLGTWYRRPHADHAPLDICDEQSVQSIVADFQPDAIYLAAGMNQIDFAESHPDECRAVNVEGVANVVRAVAESGAMLIYFSTGHVFGECKSSMNEDDDVNPVNIHGQASSEAERTIRDLLPERHLILRTNWVYGPEYRGKNPAAHAVRRMRDGHSIATTTDRFCQPTYGPDLANVAVDLVKHDCRGTYHAVGSERMTEFAFYRTAAFLYGFDSDLVEGVPALELGEEAPRPRSLWLDRFKLRSELGPKALRAPGEGLRAMRELEHTLVAARAA